MGRAMPARVVWGCGAVVQRVGQYNGKYEQHGRCVGVVGVGRGVCGGGSWEGHAAEVLENVW